MTSKAVRFLKTGSIPSVLHLATDIPIPTATPTTAVVRIKAAAINPADAKNIEGSFPNTTLPRTPGRDFAGVIVSGPDHLIGKKVWGTGGSYGLTADGSHAQYMSIPVTGIAEIPSNLSFTQAAACGVGFLTAATMLRRAGVKKGDYVLVLGSSGAVGSAAVQVAKSLGAIPIETSRRETPGAVNTTSDAKSFLEQIHKITNNKGVSATLDTVADQELFRKCVPALAMGGNHVIITRPRGESGDYTFDALELYRMNRAVLGVNTFLVGFEEAVGVLNSLKGGFEDGTLKPPGNIREVDMADEKAVVEAYVEVGKGARGKVVLVNNEE